MYAYVFIDLFLILGNNQSCYATFCWIELKLVHIYICVYIYMQQIGGNSNMRCGCVWIITRKRQHLTRHMMINPLPLHATFICPIDSSQKRTSQSHENYTLSRSILLVGGQDSHNERGIPRTKHPFTSPDSPGPPDSSGRFRKVINKVNAAAGAAMRYGARLPTFSIRIPRGRETIFPTAM